MSKRQYHPTLQYGCIFFIFHSFGDKGRQEKQTHFFCGPTLTGDVAVWVGMTGPIFDFPGCGTLCSERSGPALGSPLQAGFLEGFGASTRTRLLVFFGGGNEVPLCFCWGRGRGSLCHSKGG